MNVLFLTHRLPYAPNRGDRIRAYYLLEQLSTFADVSLFSLVHDDDEEAHAATMPFARHVRSARVPVWRNRLRGIALLPSSTPLTHSLLDAPDATRTLEAMVRSHPPDVVLAYCSGMVRWAMAAPLDRTPFVLDMVDVDSAKWAELGARSRPPLNWIYRREAATLSAFEARAARQARATLVVNAREGDMLRRLAPEAVIHVVPNGIDADGFAPPSRAAPSASSAQHPATVVFCGVMSYEPNVEGVLWFAKNVWPRVRQARPDARFQIVGADPVARIRTLADGDSSITVTGRVDRVQPYLWEAAVSVAPLRVARGLQNKVVEALAAGLPVVATPAVIEGLPNEALAGCREGDSETSFAGHVIDLLALGADGRRALAASVRLDGLQWAQQLAPLEQILASAVDAGGPRERNSMVRPGGTDSQITGLGPVGRTGPGRAKDSSVS